jgi:hypothetical protein
MARETRQLEGKHSSRASSTKWALREGQASPFCFCHGARDLRCIVLGDDFVFVGGHKDIEWIQCDMNDRFLVKVIGRLRGYSSDLNDLWAVERVLRWTVDSICAKADPRHQEILVAQLSAGLRSLSAPGAKDRTAKEEEEGAENE